jgi:histone H3/H4
MIKVHIGNVKNIFKDFLKINNKDLWISKDAVILLSEKLPEFERNVLKIASETTISENRKVITEKDISDALNSRVNGPRIVPLGDRLTPNPAHISEGSE